VEAWAPWPARPGAALAVPVRPPPDRRPPAVAAARAEAEAAAEAVVVAAEAGRGTAKSASGRTSPLHLPRRVPQGDPGGAEAPVDCRPRDALLRPGPNGETEGAPVDGLFSSGACHSGPLGAGISSGRGAQGYEAGWVRLGARNQAQVIHPDRLSLRRPHSRRPVPRSGPRPSTTEILNPVRGIGLNRTTGFDDTGAT
jgi:hypothetical protein